jgi:hypothetical protein
MSEDNQADTTCASCGTAEIDDVKLKPCDDCDLVRYCSDECQRDHKSQHEEDCKKRAAELRGELLFKQPESSHLGDCPICCLPMSLEPDTTRIMSCCGKEICRGCDIAHLTSKNTCCPFCRHPVPTEEESEMHKIQRVEANDRVALSYLGALQCTKGDYRTALDFLTKAAGLGDMEAHYNLAIMHRNEQGVEKDKKKEVHHLEEAAIGGHPGARYLLACHEWENGRKERAEKHLFIAATQGEKKSMRFLMESYKEGYTDKMDLAATLRAHQKALDATKSPQREKAAELYQMMGRNWGSPI